MFSNSFDWRQSKIWHLFFADFDVLEVKKIQIYKNNLYRSILTFSGELWGSHGGPIKIFTLDNNFLRWTCFGRTKFIHSWKTLVQAMLRVSDVIDKCKSWLADVPFDWRHAMVTAVERNNQTRRIITFLCRLFAKLKSKFHKKWTKSMYYKYKKWISFFWGSWKYDQVWTQRVPCIVNVTPFGLTY